MAAVQAFYAFYTLYESLNGGVGDLGPFSGLEDVARRVYLEEGALAVSDTQRVSLFITWKKRERLRGCIGTFGRLPAARAVQRYALVSALEDSRFPPIQLRELPELHCTCNILDNFTIIYSKQQDSTGGPQDIFDWDVGTHGVELKFRDPWSHTLRSATFLPEVMLEQHWDKRATFENLVQKAGCSDGAAQHIVDHYEKYFVEVIRYEGYATEIAYPEFMRKWSNALPTD
ncbi:uncharacterized protein KNAG_0G03000 [Huiozyma naganishii CBS 8797]|uniref:AMMECR1 domain-containing protein n=1 Tax=Huiozyma naganishii (strain ATCC MYA-139 / BCRC 22969 / CBS 8797 / KCTC 17520 / NBRC 10181 / NCYC 3082 / Yp74L-3) TaxID=1071383 RepID=J7S195_HUIN7|nr:hypothetical protein KNAG_0G03000 [Kazachstania naganishii CBS 8797]CCK71357.1 hypothetical protein KNAG_0G03000 [Kazachstania naganishii CBS 8797]